MERQMSAGAAPVHGEIRYFQIGFQRCGTTALAAFFNRCGISCVHHDQGRLARRMRDNLAAGARPLEGYEHYRAFTNLNLNAPDDYFDAFKHYEALRRAYGGKFILNTRPVEHWVRSVMAHQSERFGRAALRRHYELRLGAADPARVAAYWRAEHEAHHRRVREEIPGGILLEFDIESDPPELLCDFIGLPRACARHWRRQNPTMNGLGRLAASYVPLAAKRWIPDRVKQPLKMLLRAR